MSNLDLQSSQIMRNIEEGIIDDINLSDDEDHVNDHNNNSNEQEVDKIFKENQQEDYLSLNELNKVFYFH